MSASKTKAAIQRHIAREGEISPLMCAVAIFFDQACC
jgi:hypothetical protein